MKKLLSILLVLALILSMSISAFAAEPYTAQDTWEEISFEEAVIQKMNYDNITYEEAEAELREAEERILAELGMTNTMSRQNAARSNPIQYYNYSKTCTYDQNSNYSCLLLATICTFLDYGTTRYIDSVLGTATQRAPGVNDYEWVETVPAWSRISYDKRSVDLGATGYFTFTTSYSTTIDGFVSNTIGGNVTYISDPFELLETYRLS